MPGKISTFSVINSICFVLLAAGVVVVAAACRCRGGGGALFVDI